MAKQAKKNGNKTNNKTGPASHNLQNFTDKESISLIENILSSHRRVMPHLDSIDKWPNIDGRVDLQSEDYQLLGRLDIQAKTLKTNSLKINCPVTFLSSCELDPCVLLAVDNINKRIYWRYLDAIEVKKIALKPGQAYKVITFEPNQCIDSDKTSYIDKWAALAKKNQERLNHHDDLKEAYLSLSKRSNEAIGESHRDFNMVHNFLDALNSKFDNEFLSIKQKIFPNAWKLGLALYDYKENTLSYTIYPIPTNKNDVQIKRVDKQLRDDLREQGLGFHAHFVENPIESKPQIYATGLIESYTMKLFEKGLLNPSKHELISAEYIFHVIDTCKESMKIEDQDSYSAKDILKNEWVQELRKVRLLSYHGKNIDIAKFVRMLEEYASRDETVSRPYKRFDYSRGGGWIWNFYTKEEAEEVFLKVIKNWAAAYDDVIDNNFPLLKKDLSMWGDADLMLVKPNLKDEYRTYDGPTYESYFLKSVHQDNIFRRVEVAPEDLLPQLREFWKRHEETVLYEGRPYKLTAVSHSVLDLIFHDLPLTKLVDETLERSLKAYFARETS